MTASPPGSTRTRCSVSASGCRTGPIVLKALVEEHARETQSRFAERMLIHWDRELGRFWQVIPYEMVRRYDHPVLAEEDAERSA